MEIINIDEYYKLGATPKSIFHYTSGEVLVKIIDNKQLRFTNCMFLNDKEEYKYFKKLINDIKNNSNLNEDIKNTLKMILDYLKDDNDDSFLVRKDKGFSFHEGKYYVFCGSLNNDSLPMWNYYVKNNNFTGYSIGISIDSIVDTFSKMKGECYLGKVIYNKEMQIQIILNFINSISKRFDAHMALLSGDVDNTNEDEKYKAEQFFIDEYQTDLYEFCRYMRLFFKDDAFSYENEYRVVVLIDSDSNSNVKKNHSIRNGIIVPSVDISFKKNIFEEVIVSPTMEEDICYLGLKDLFNDKKISVNKISKSNIKIR